MHQLFIEKLCFEFKEREIVDIVISYNLYERNR